MALGLLSALAPILAPDSTSASIGLNITKHTEYYPMATGVAAVTSVAGNLLVVPSFGIVGAAWANLLAYAVLAFVSWRFSQRFFSMEYESRRLAKIVIAATAGVSVAHVAIPVMGPVASLLLHGMIGGRARRSARGAS